ncbi:MAG: glycosyltransferase family 4 protein, partial [Armatimonadota bacterium]|nr:glycosyltransferase family 4 protein [Armatimonadota bacterium]
MGNGDDRKGRKTVLRICSPHLGIAPETNLGGEVYERELLKTLLTVGVRVELLLAEGKPYSPTSGMHVTRVPVSVLGRKLSSLLRFPPLIARVYRERGYDLLRAHSARYIGPLVLWARRRYRLPVPVVVHHHHLETDLFRGAIERRVMLAADLVVTVSGFSKGQLVNKLRIPPEKVAVVAPGIEHRFNPGPRPEALARRLGVEGRNVLFSLGLMGARKNFEELLYLFREILRERGPRVCLIIGGIGPRLARLRQLVHSLGLENAVRLPGFIPEVEKPEYYRLADIFVFASRLEGFGLAVAEAMSCGRPVVAYARGSLPEV